LESFKKCIRLCFIIDVVPEIPVVVQNYFSFGLVENPPPLPPPFDDEILKNVDTDKFGKKEVKHYIRYHVKNMYNTFFKDESVMA
jgi:hypothetical protein